jgi:CheY-like chemotaxis protein
MKPDIAIVDYSMPVMNGLDVSRRIKSYRLSTEVLIVVSAQAMAFETRRMGVGF